MRPRRDHCPQGCRTAARTSSSQVTRASFLAPKRANRPARARIGDHGRGQQRDQARAASHSRIAAASRADTSG